MTHEFKTPIATNLALDALNKPSKQDNTKEFLQVIS
jgi:hypothetical protein